MKHPNIIVPDIIPVKRGLSLEESSSWCFGWMNLYTFSIPLLFPDIIIIGCYG